MLQLLVAAILSPRHQGQASQETESLASEDNTASIDISGQKIVVCTESGEAADGVGAQN